MGRGRLRRGCSLEVIFEEDPDFCSHLDSLDGGIAIRFGIKEPDETISLDSLLEVEEYQVRFEDPADAEQVFRSLDGFIDVRNMDSCMVEWDEFSMDSNSSRNCEEDTGNVTTTEKDSVLDSSGNVGTSSATESEKAPSGRRSRVSRRQIIQATWLGYNSSSDESITNNDPDDIDNNDSAAPLSKTHRRRSPTNRHTKGKAGNAENERKSDNGGSGEEASSSSGSSNSIPSSTNCITAGNSSSVIDDNPETSSSNPVGSPNLVISVEDFTENNQKEEGMTLKTPIQLHLRASPNNNAPHGIFGRLTDTTDTMEKDTLDSYLSTMTDETDANVYTFADPFDDTNSVASTSYESSGSTSSSESNGSVCTVNSFSMKNGRSKANGNEGKTGNMSNPEHSDGFSSINCSNGTGSKYKSNLKVELVSQLNKSQEESSHSAISTTNSKTLTSLPPPPSLQLEVTASSSATVNPSSHLYSTNSHLNLESSSISAPVPLKHSAHNKSLLHRQQDPQMNHHQPLSSTDHERQSLSGEVKRVRALFELRNHSRSKGSGSSSNGSTCPSSPESPNRSAISRNANNGGRVHATGDNSTYGNASRRVGLYSKNGRRSRGSPPHQLSSAASPNKVLKTTSSSSASPTQMINRSRGSPGAGNNPSYDYEDVLVNENVVIEDSPDIFQTTRSRRNGNNFDRDSVPSPPISNKRPITIMNLCPMDGSGPGPLATSSIPSEGSLWRSQSMGTGISSLGSPSAYGNGILKQSSSKTNILAEELPAPDTVKNVRNVFENMLKMRGKNTHGSENSVDIASNIITPSSFSGSFSIVKKSLSYIKSNPTSKIYRSESMRDDFPSMNRRFGKPILLSEQNSPVHSPGYPSPSLCMGGNIPSSSSPTLSSVAENTADRKLDSEGPSRCITEDSVDGRSKRSNSLSPTNKNNAIEGKVSEPAKFSLKINTALSPSSVPNMLRTSCQVPLTEEDPSFSSNVSYTDDYRTRKYVHSDVLQKIRSAGTTTTYFGGKIVAKTVKNRKIPVARRHTFDFQDYVGISGEGTLADYESYNSINCYRDDKTKENKGFGFTSSATAPNAYDRRDSSRPALDIPLKSSNHYASRNTTISGALDSIFAGGVGGLLTFASKPIDTTPRIISVVHKSPPGSQTGSPIKSCSPVSSVIEEGRNSPEGCEASNEKTVEQDGNNNNLTEKVDSSSTHCAGEAEGFNKKFSQITEGAWF